MTQEKFFTYLSLTLLCVTAVLLIALQIKPFGWYTFIAGLIALYFCPNDFRKHIFLVYISLGILGLTSINTEVSITHMSIMGFMIIMALMVPYYISRYVYKDHIVTYPFHHGRRWNNWEIFYIFFAGAVTYIVFPFMLRETGSYMNWQVEPGFYYLGLFFIGTNALGIWDELFFINTVLPILRKHLPFTAANMIQAVLFTSFLFELGFRGWAFIPIYGFALLQGWVYKKTHSLLYIITIHLTVDLILYLVLIYLHHPEWLPLFIT